MGSMAVARLPSGFLHEFMPSPSSRQVAPVGIRCITYILPMQMKNLGNAPKFFCANGISRRCSPQVHISDARCFSGKIQFSLDREMRRLSCSAQVTGSGVEASFAEPKENDISLRDVQMVIESCDDGKIQVRVDLTGEETQRVFDDVLKNLARTAPPIPGFRKTKGGKTSNIPKSFLLQILGRDRVYKFIIQEIVSTTIRDYVTRENLKVGNKCNTIQTAEELESTFSPGLTFGFNATLELESEPETSDPSSSEE